MKNEKLKVFETYAKAVEEGKFAEAFALLSDDIIWHMGGEGPLSGVIKGKEALSKALKEFVERSKATFKVVTNWYACNDCFVVASVVSLAERGDKKLNNPGVDLFKIENGKIQEVWTFSELQEIEDKFWE